MFEQREIAKADTQVSKDFIGTDHPGLLTIKQFCSAFPWPSESAMRAYVYRAEELGISDAFLRVGRRVLVMPQKFFFLIRQLESRSAKGGLYASTVQKRAAR